jgi:5'(3')-deoxyribonucleotidase
MQTQHHQVKQRMRQYSISTNHDSENIHNYRCPEYALNWDHKNNKHHWTSGHDYFLGNGKNITDNLELRQILSEKLARGTLPSKIVFCDLDGVLADFEQGVVNRFHKRPDELQPGVMWGVINKSNTFFETLPWMPRGRELWEQIKQYDPIILTGIPRNTKAAEQKRRWCARELGSDIQVITCSTKNKPQYCITDAVLIDDGSDNLNEWQLKGGKFILYDEEFTDKVVDKIHQHMNIEIEPGLCTP